MYSLLLGLAIALTCAAWLLLIARRWLALPRRSPSLAAWLAMLVDASSLAVHLASGHRPGTPEAMGPVRFLADHPAFLVVAAAAMLASIVSCRLASCVRAAAPLPETSR